MGYYFGKYEDLNTVFFDLNSDFLRNCKQILYLRCPGFPLSGDVTSKLSPERPQDAPTMSLSSSLVEDNQMEGLILIGCFASLAALTLTLVYKPRSYDLESKSAALLLGK